MDRHPAPPGPQPGLRHLVHAFAAVAVAIAGANASAAELSFAHYAPGAGEIRLQVDESAPFPMRYRDFSALQTFSAGAHRMRALRADGSVLAQENFTLTADDRYVFIVAGNGGANAPFQLRFSIDHNHPLLGDQYSLQSVNRAIPSERVNPYNRNVPESTYTHRQCGEWLPGSLPPTPLVAEGWGEGTGDFQQFQVAFSGLSKGPANRTCRLVLRRTATRSDPPLAEVVWSARPGDRLRRFSIGDGVHEPFEIVMVNQGQEPVLGVIEPGAQLEGLWYAPRMATGVGFQAAFDPEAPEGRRLSGAFFGFESDGQPSWRLMAPDTRFPTEGPYFVRTDVIEYLGGVPDGTRAGVPFFRGRVEVLAHSCSDMTLIPESHAHPRSPIFPRFPRNAIRLNKLFPPGCPTSASTANKE